MTYFKRVLTGFLALTLVLSGALNTTAFGANFAFVPGEVLVVLKSTSSAEAKNSAASALPHGRACLLQAVASSAGAEVQSTYSALSSVSGTTFALIKSETQTTEEMLEELAKWPEILAASPNYIQHLNAEPKDPYFTSGDLWGMEAIRAPEAWDETVGSEDVYVAIIDSGIDTDHEDLKDNLDTELSRNFVAESDEDENVDPSHFEDGGGHGSHVAGTIGAVGDNGTGVVGVNWKVKLIVLRVLNDEGLGRTSDIIAALNYLVELMKERPDLRLVAVNLSLGGYEPVTPEDIQTNPEYLAYKILNDMDRAVIIVAAGNEGMEVGAPTPFDDPVIRKNGKPRDGFKRGWYCYPASYPGLSNMIVVGASAPKGEAADFSNWSETKVDLVAPGVDIYSTVPQLPEIEEEPGYKHGECGGYVNWDGTSMATPHVTGAVALLAARYPEKTPSELKAYLLEFASADVNPVPQPWLDEYYEKYEEYKNANPEGKKVSRQGLLDVKAALDALADPDVKFHTITASAERGGRVEPSGAVRVRGGKAQTFTFIPDSGYEVFNVLVDKVPQGAVSQYTFSNVSEAHTLSAYFVQTPPPEPAPEPTPKPMPNRGSGGGCSAGTGAIAMFALLGAVLLRWKRD
ncbi:MAG: S8 family serine peptidase [Fretibacterium sp.]|nr:S8 family serine peptidase [Fretibacterium sp.]